MSATIKFKFSTKFRLYLVLHSLSYTHTHRRGYSTQLFEISTSFARALIMKMSVSAVSAALLHTNRVCVIKSSNNKWQAGNKWNLKHKRIGIPLLIPRTPCRLHWRIFCIIMKAINYKYSKVCLRLSVCVSVCLQPTDLPALAPTSAVGQQRLRLKSLAVYCESAMQLTIALRVGHLL